MKAMVLEKFGGIEYLHMTEMATPALAEGEVLIRIAYAGVNPVDWKIREGYLKDMIPHDFPIILGWDVAGTVMKVGKNVENLRIGDEVFSYIRKPIVKWGAYAEFVAFTAADVVRKPKNLTLAQAGALPLVSLTAWQALFDFAHVKRGETVLIQGGSGGVGSMAIQFAKWAGAKVIATASTKKHDYIKSLGADVAIDYHEDFESRIEKVDLVFDCVGGEAFTKSLPCLKRGGRIVSILEQMDPAQAKRLGIEASYVFVRPNGAQLATIADLIEKGHVKPPHIEEMRLDEAGKAQEKLKAGNVLGKIVLKVS